jgi:hypothetical protein
MIKQNSFILAIAVLFIAAFSRLGIFYFFAPSVSQDLNAYYLLVKAVGSESLQTAINYADQADNTASDPKLQDVANSIKSIYEIYLGIGIKTQRESNSLMGFCKSMYAGANDPASGLYHSAQLFYYGWGLEDKANNLDSVYGAQRQAYINDNNIVHEIGAFVFWGLLGGGWLFLYQSYKSAK